MQLIDDDGRLFGIVNIVDALVAVFVLAVVVAGAALVAGGGEERRAPPTDTVHATLDLGNQSPSVAAALDVGDAYSPGPDSRLAVTDVHLSPRNGSVRAIVRVAIEGPVDGETVEYAGGPPRLGRTIGFNTSRYDVDGRVVALGDDETLARTNATVVTRDTVTARVARELAIGDAIRVDGRTVATIDDLVVHPDDDPDRRVVHLQADFVAHRQQDRARFGGRVVEPGRPVTLPGDGYTLSGTIERVGGGLNRSTVDVLVRDTVDLATADGLSAGDAVTVAGTNAATVERVVVYATNDSERRRAFLGLSLATVGYDGRPRFGDGTVRTGRPLALRPADDTLDGVVERVGHLQQRGTPTTRTVRLRIGGMREPFASAIGPGMTESVDGRTVAEVTDVTTEPTTVTVTGDRGSFGVHEHPYRRDVTVTAELRVRETVTGVRFKGRSIGQRDRVTLHLGSVTVRGRVVRIG